MPRDGTKEVWRWYGTAGHFIGAQSCCFHLHTRVGTYRVSTVGCYHHADDPDCQQPPVEIGLGRLYETMVFRLAADDFEGDPHDWIELDSDGYNDPDEAEAGHLRMCEKWGSR